MVILKIEKVKIGKRTRKIFDYLLIDLRLIWWGVAVSMINQGD
jgi:hypothetical protein